MASGKEITGKIKSVENTKKVTSALEMVSASKIRKSQDLMNATRPYARMMRRIIGHLGKANPEYRHPFTIEHTGEVKKAVSYTHLRAHETPEHLVCRLLLEKKKKPL